MSDVQVPATLAVLAGLRRLIRKEPAATKVTVTRVTSDHGEPVPETVVVTTQEPEKDTIAIRLVRLTLVLSATTLTVVVVTVGFRILRHELRYHR